MKSGTTTNADSAQVLEGGSAELANRKVRARAVRMTRRTRPEEWFGTPAGVMDEWMSQRQ